eukprot:scaffold143003_cov23-Prasinocladus_malaysianus.AAC.1
MHKHSVCCKIVWVALAMCHLRRQRAVWGSMCLRRGCPAVPGLWQKQHAISVFCIGHIRFNEKVVSITVARTDIATNMGPSTSASWLKHPFGTVKDCETPMMEPWRRRRRHFLWSH